ncbi:hypothetical protein D3C81_1414110 [compost metagenome]
MGGQQIAFDPIRDEVQAFAIRALALRCQAYAEPGRQLRAFNQRDIDIHGGLLQAGDPGRFLRGPVELGQRNKRDIIWAQRRRIILQRLAAILARLAGRNAQLYQLLVAEQRLRLIGGQQFAPFETAVNHQDFAFGIRLRARRLAYLVGCFQCQQMLIARDDIQAGQRLVQMSV